MNTFFGELASLGDDRNTSLLGGAHHAFGQAELKHGRVAMLATVGWIATDLGGWATRKLP